MIVVEQEDRSPEYDEYLNTHIDNVIKAWKEILRSAIDDGDVVHNVDLLINSHDASKHDKDEYDAYLNHFYPANGGDIPDEDPEFDLAWLKHIHNNPHHWQYWVLVRDSGETVGIDMPMESICEMLCDWSSFQFTGKGTANEWYEKNKDKMILSDATRDIVEDLLERCKEL